MKQMPVKVFVDTNIFVYLQSTTDDEKRTVSRRVIDTFDCVASIQVLNEVSNVLSKKAGFLFKQIGEIVDGIVQACEISIVTYETVRKAHVIASDNQIGYYDSLIISSALESGCEYLITEDLNDGQRINGSLKIVNIFKHPDFFDI
jgi:predicted nucleic acid-binding protein